MIPLFLQKYINLFVINSTALSGIWISFIRSAKVDNILILSQMLPLRYNKNEKYTAFRAELYKRWQGL